MDMVPFLDVRPEVKEAVRAGAGVVALESTLIAHGLPWPLNFETARARTEEIRALPQGFDSIHDEVDFVHGREIRRDAARGPVENGGQLGKCNRLPGKAAAGPAAGCR